MDTFLSILILAGLAVGVAADAYASSPPRREPLTGHRLQLSLAEVQALLSEQARLLAEETRNKRHSIAFSLLAMIILTTVNHSALDTVERKSVAFALLFCFTRVVEAGYQDGVEQKTWARLLLGLVVDLRRRRVWEIEDQLEAAGVWPRNEKLRFLPKYFWWTLLLPLAPLLSPIALILTVLGYKDAAARGKPVGASIKVGCWSAFWVLIHIGNALQ